MKASVLTLAGSLLALTATHAQKAVFAVTAAQPGQINWTQIQQLQPDGQAPALLLDATLPGQLIAARTRQAVTPQINGLGADALPAAGGVAALAYDAVHQRLFFSPLFRDGGIRYIDLRSRQKQPAVVVFDEAYNLVDRARDGEGRNITRMTIGADGYGYAISNDGNSFIRFATAGKVSVENLGQLIDDSRNGQQSVHNACNAWGGDMVAGADGKLYLFTMRQQVYKIDPASRVATYLGALKGVDASFSVNGAAVVEDGSVLLASSTQPNARLRVRNMETLEAGIETVTNWYNAADLASAHLLFANKVAPPAPVVLPEAASVVSVYPNPVTNGRLTLQVNKLKAGRYAVDLVNASGSALRSMTLQVRQAGETASFATGQLPGGLYILRISNAGRQEVFTEKVMIQQQ
ncbi:MAG: T9SS type A sorting domain-containing protein [Chitinophagaceae bacterium]|jgi:hypothetical protein|nr:T9SS type A sorting domain-containing protein [Chitinophagaceae bacterium]